MEIAAGFRDPRLIERQKKLTLALEKAPNRSFPQVFQNPSELEAAYRFFSNVKVTPAAILAEHHEKLREHVSSLSEFLLVHDTTDFSYNPNGKRKGIGRKTAAEGSTFFAHVSLLLSACGRRHPVGVAALETWVRGDAPQDEHGRWLRGVQEGMSTLGTANVIHVMDREGDDYALFDRLVANGHRFVIRSAHDRLIVDHGNGRKLKEATQHLERRLYREVVLSQRIDGTRGPVQRKIHPSREKRLAHLVVGSTELELLRPKLHPRDKARPGTRVGLAESLKLNLVRVWEPTPPDGETPIEWTLLTTESVETPADVARIVDYYRARWTIEEYFKVLKTGCKMEERQLSDYQGLCNALAIFIPIACTALLLRSAAKEAPDDTDALALDDDEITVIRALRPKALSPKPTTREVLLAVASIGGYIKRKDDPGWLTITRGIETLTATVVGWRLAKLQYVRDQP